MFQRSKYTLIAGAAAAVLWAVGYFMFVAPMWAERDQELENGRAAMKDWLDRYKPAKETQPLPVARKELDARMASYHKGLEELKAIHFVRDLREMGPFTLASAKGDDPKNYFDKKRNEISKAVAGAYELQMAPELGDLGFSDDDVGLNLARLFVLKRFFAALKSAKGKEAAYVDGIRYPKPRVIGFDEAVPADAATNAPPPAGRLFMIPLKVRLRLPERNFAQLLYDLQPNPADVQNATANKEVCYFLLRGVEAQVRDKADGTLYAEIAVGAIFPEQQFVKELKIPYEEPRQSYRGAAPEYRSDGY